MRNETKAHIREATEKDIESILDILQNRVLWLRDRGIKQWGNYRLAYDKDYFRNKMQSGDKCYIAENGDETVGVVMVEKRSEYFEHLSCSSVGYYIRHLAAVKKGVGKELISFSERLASGEGKTFLYTNCNSRNGKLVAYYKNNGFVIIGEGFKEEINYPYYLLSKRL